jgi:predicted transcriptional regulator
MVTANDLLKKTFVKVDVKDTVGDFLGSLRSKKQTFAVVFDGKKYVGITGRRWLLTSRVDAGKTKMSNMMKQASKKRTAFFVPKLKPDTGLKEVCRLMASADSRALPVLDKQGKVLGVVTARAVLRKIKSAYKSIPVSALATKKLVTIGMRDTVGDAIKTMNRSNVDRLPVLAKNGKLAGIVTEFDILKRFHKFPPARMKYPSEADHSGWADPSWDSGEKTRMVDLPVENIMTPYPMVITADFGSTIAAAIDVLVDEDVNSVVLMENDRPEAMLTVKDVLDDYSRE